MADVEETKTRCFGFPAAASSTAVSVPSTFADRSFSYGYTQCTCTRDVRARPRQHKNESRRTYQGAVVDDRVGLARDAHPRAGVEPEPRLVQVAPDGLDAPARHPRLVPHAPSGRAVAQARERRRVVRRAQRKRKRDAERERSRERYVPCLVP